MSDHGNAHVERPAESPITVSGKVTAQFVFDGGWAVDVSALRQNFEAATDGWTLESDAKVEASERGTFKYACAPLRVVLNCPTVEFNSLSTTERAEVLIDDSGAISITLSVEFSGTELAKLVPLSAAMYNSEPLRAAARTLANSVLAAIKRYVDQPVPPLDETSRYEDYFVVHIEKIEGSAVTEVLETQRLVLAQILLGEEDPLHEDQINDTLEHARSYHPDDRLIIDWRSALCIGGGWEDVAMVLTIANLELLELTVLHEHLQNKITEMRERFLTRWPTLRRWTGSNLREVQRLDHEVQLQLERIDNPLSLTGDSFLAKVYDKACEILQVKKEEDKVKEKIAKLEGNESTYDGRSAIKRADWIGIGGIVVAIPIVIALIEALTTFVANLFAK